jgi:hypothetical protein
MSATSTESSIGTRAATIGRWLAVLPAWFLAAAAVNLLWGPYFLGEVWDHLGFVEQSMNDPDSFAGHTIIGPILVTLRSCTVWGLAIIAPAYVAPSNKRAACVCISVLILAITVLLGLAALSLWREHEYTTEALIKFCLTVYPGAIVGLLVSLRIDLAGQRQVVA